MTNILRHKFVVGALFVTLGILAFNIFTVQAGHDGNLAGYWSLDDGSGTTAEDSSGHGNDGDVMGGAAFTNVGIAPILGNDYALSFDGTDDFIEVPHDEELDMTSAYSLSVWFNVESVPDNVYRPIAFRGTTDANDIEVYIQARTGDLVVAHNRGNGGAFDFVGFADPDVGKLVHLAVTFDGTDVKAYYDGVEAAVTQRTSAMSVPSDTDKGWWFGKVDHASFGTLPGGSDVNLFEGLMDEIRLYSAALTEDEIDDLSSDGDGVGGDSDLCVATGPDYGTEGFDPADKSDLKPNRWAVGDIDWEQGTGKKGNANDKEFSLADTYGCNCNQILDVLEEKTGEDFEGHRKFGCSQSVLEDWIAGEYNLGPAVLDTVFVSGETADVTESSLVAEDGVEYTLETSGTYRFANWGDFGIADTEWASRRAANYPPAGATEVWPDEGETEGWVKGEGYYASACGLDVQIDGSCVDWGAFSETHEYSLPYTGTGAPIEFSIFDSSYSDNVGGITVDIIGDLIVDLW